NELSMQVEALRTLHDLKATNLQMRSLLKLAEGTADKSASRQEANVSEKYLKTLRNLRDALLKGDDDAIDDLGNQLDELAKAEDADLDDTVETTDAARKAAPKALALFHAPQVVNHLAAYEEVPHP